MNPARDQVGRVMEKAIMDRRLFVSLSAALAATAVFERSAGADTVPGSEDERLHALLDTFLDEILNEQPLLAGPHALARIVQVQARAPAAHRSRASLGACPG